MSEMTAGATPERLWVQRLSTDEKEMSWYEGWETKDEEPMFPETEYVRADIYYREFAKLEAVRAVIHRWIDSRGNGDLNNGGGMLEILNILYPSPAPTGDKKGTQP